jgi:hypothetical protein
MPRLQANRTKKIFKGNARETINSGATMSDGDAHIQHPHLTKLDYNGVAIEAKSTQTKSFSITKDLWEKMEDEARAINKMPAFLVDLENYGITTITVSYNDFLAILQELKAFERWKHTVIDRCIVGWHHVDDDNPSATIDNLIAEECKMALDPQISQDAVKLIEKYGGKYEN